MLGCNHDRGPSISFDPNCNTGPSRPYKRGYSLCCIRIYYTDFIFCVKFKGPPLHPVLGTI